MNKRKLVCFGVITLLVCAVLALVMVGGEMRGEVTAADRDAFERIRGMYPDTAALLSMPHTDLIFPVMFRDGDNEFYLSHGNSGKADKFGAVYIEDYSSTDFSDPVTVIYGHTLEDGGPFSELKKVYSDTSFYSEDRFFQIVTEDCVRKYRIFAAVPYSAEHLLYGHDYGSESEFNDLIAEITSVRLLSAYCDLSVNVDFGDKIIVLSTCMLESENMRFLVAAVCVDETFYE